MTYESPQILRRHGPNAKIVVRETSEQSLTIRRPSNRHALRLPSLLTHFSVSRFELINDRPGNFVNESGKKG